MEGKDYPRCGNKGNKIHRAEQMRKVLKDTDDLAMAFDEKMLSAMHDQIMQKIATIEMEPPRQGEKVKRYLRSHWRGWLYSGSKTLMFVGLISAGAFQIAENFKPHQSLVGIDSQTQKIVVELAESSEDFSKTILTNVSDDEFFVDLALQSNDTLNSAKINKILGTN